MPTNNTWELKFPLFFYFLSLSSFLLIHIWDLHLTPGLHFDEAWAANYSVRIATEADFWPIKAMSPYTMPWTHYIAAIFFDQFEINLFFFRLSQISLSFIGVALISLAFWFRSWKKLAVISPFFISTVPVLVANHRFAIELNSMHVFCFGLFVFGVLACDRKNIWPRILIYLAVVLGVTAHILFLAPALALLVCLFTLKVKLTKKDRVLVAAICLSLLPFFALATAELPKKGKGIALICFDAIVLLWCIQGSLFHRWRKYFQLPLLVLITVAAVPFVFNMLFFFESSWSFLITHGRIYFPYFIGVQFLLCVFLFWQLRDQLKTQSVYFLGLYVTLCCITSGLMMLKQTPRYYEISLLSFSLLLCLLISRLSKKTFTLFLLGFSVLGLLQLNMNYFLPANKQISRERDFRFFTFSDSSRDFLSKQGLVLELAAKGCSYKDVNTNDMRVRAALDFLQNGDWFADPQQECPWKSLHLEREMSENHFNIRSIAHKSAGFLIWDWQE